MQSFVSKRILVTGGAGFLGSHLCRFLLNENHHVTCLDNFYTGCHTNINALKENSNFSLIEHDICEPIDIKVDVIYNLACPASPPHYQTDPVKTTQTSVLGSIHLLELAKKQGSLIFQASTSEVYGDPLVHPQVEWYWGNVNPIGSRSCYDEGKRVAETLFMAYRQQYGLPIKIARIFNTYGPHMLPNDGRVVSNFILQALKNESITIYGKGLQTRSFAYVDDLIEGIAALMKTPDTFIGPVNLGNPNEYTVLELAEIIIELTNSSSKIEFRPLPEDDPQKRQPDISLARKMLQWEPKTSLKAGLKKTIAYFDKILKGDS